MASNPITNPPTTCPLSHLSPCSFMFSNMSTDTDGKRVYIYVCHTHQYGIMSYRRINYAHEEDDVQDHYCDTLTDHNEYYFGERNR